MMIGAVMMALCGCLSQAQHLVAPGAMTQRGGGGGSGGRGGGWGVVGKWPAGFFIAGSSIDEMNGLYIPIGIRDDTLPQEGIMTWGNLGSAWVIANVEARSYVSLGNKPMEWVLYDQDGVARFAHEGGAYLPGCGDDWHVVHRRKPSARRFRSGDRVKLKKGRLGNGGQRGGGDDHAEDEGGGMAGVVIQAPVAPSQGWAHCWPLGNNNKPSSDEENEDNDGDDDDGGDEGDGRVVGCGSGGHVPQQLGHDQEPVLWRLKGGDQHREFTSPAWHLELLSSPSALPSREKRRKKDKHAAGGDGGDDEEEEEDCGEDGDSKSGDGDYALANNEDDPDELPWQVVALMNVESLAGYVDRWRAHDSEVKAARSLPSRLAQEKKQQQQQQQQQLMLQSTSTPLLSGPSSSSAPPSSSHLDGADNESGGSLAGNESSGAAGSGGGGGGGGGDAESAAAPMPAPLLPAMVNAAATPLLLGALQRAKTVFAKLEETAESDNNEEEDDDDNDGDHYFNAREDHDSSLLFDFQKAASLLLGSAANDDGSDMDDDEVRDAETFACFLAPATASSSNDKDDSDEGVGGQGVCPRFDAAIAAAAARTFVEESEGRRGSKDDVVAVEVQVDPNQNQEEEQHPWDVKRHNQKGGVGGGSGDSDSWSGSVLAALLVGRADCLRRRLLKGAHSPSSEAPGAALPSTSLGALSSSSAASAALALVETATTFAQAAAAGVGGASTDSYSDSDTKRKNHGSTRSGRSKNSNARVHFLKGLALLDLDRPSEAVAAFESVFSSTPQWPNLLHWLLAAHSRARRKPLQLQLQQLVSPLPETAAKPLTPENDAEEEEEQARRDDEVGRKGNAGTGNTTITAQTGQQQAGSRSSRSLWAWWVVGVGAPSVQGLAAIGDLVVASDSVPGFWERGDFGVVVGLGPATSPLAVRMGLSEHFKPRQANHGLLVDCEWGRLTVLPAHSAEAQAVLERAAEWEMRAAATMARGGTKNRLIGDTENLSSPSPSPISDRGSSRKLYERLMASLGRGWDVAAAAAGVDEDEGDGGGDGEWMREEDHPCWGGKQEPNDGNGGGGGLNGINNGGGGGGAGGGGVGVVGAGGWVTSDAYAILGVSADFFSADQRATPPQALPKATAVNEAVEDELLKKLYRTATKRLHPDKRLTGSERGFNLAVQAHSILSDPSKRRAYDQGLDFSFQGDQSQHDEAGALGVGSLQSPQAKRYQAFSLAEEVTRHYFPSSHGFRAFGDPFERRREREARRAQQQQPPQRHHRRP